MSPTNRRPNITLTLIATVLFFIAYFAILGLFGLPVAAVVLFLFLGLAIYFWLVHP